MGETTGAEDISSKLDAAIQGEVDAESPAAEVGSEETEGVTEKGKPPKTVPYPRFKEVNDDRKVTKERYADLETRYQKQTDSVNQLTQMLEAAKADSGVLADIKALANDPKMFPHIDALDKRLKGIEEEVEETGEASDKTLDKAKKFLEREQEKLADELADTRSTILVQRADTIADKWLEALPENYDERDRKIISRLWADEVDWTDVEQNPDKLQDVLAQTFQKTIDEYGVPRGGLIDPNDPDSYEVETEETTAPSPEEELLTIIKGKNYGALKEISVGGKKVLQPEISEEEFAADFAKALRRNRA